MNISKMQKFIVLWTDQKQTGDIALVQSKDTKTIYINSIKIIDYLVLERKVYSVGYEMNENWSLNTRNLTRCDKLMNADHVTVSEVTVYLSLNLT